MKPGETLHEYYLLMKNISNSLIDNWELLSYVIDGIPGNVFKKLILYGAHALNDFENKLTVYHKIIFHD